MIAEFPLPKSILIEQKVKSRQLRYAPGLGDAAARCVRGLSVEYLGYAPYSSLGEMHKEKGAKMVA